MKTQAIKKDGHYYIPYLEGLDLEADEVTIEIDDNILKHLVIKKSGIKQELENMNKEMGGNRLIESILDGMPDDFKYVSSGKTDNELWYEERKHKYE